MRVFFDSSVIISAIISATGGSRKLIELTKEGKLTGIISQGILEEVLSKKNKINSTEKEIINFVKNNDLLVREKITESEAIKYEDFLTDPKDTHVIAGAKLTKCKYLVTLDKKHLLQPNVRKKFKPLQIVSPKEFLEKKNLPSRDLLS